MNRDEDIFADVREIAPEARAEFLDRACAGDSALRARIVELLAGYDEAERALPAASAARDFAMTEETAGHRIGRYKLLEKIGEGGCGVVWMAEQEEPVRRRVALKVIKLGMDTKSVIARFEAERQALAMMDHPNIAKVFDAGTTDLGRPYFVMELVRGIPITRFADDAGLTTAQRLQLFIQACHAIQHAHQKGIIHRDIKPSNILVTLHDDVAVPKVIDFGIAKATQGRLTDSTVFTAFEQFIGTPAYMSPEQAEFNALDVDTRSDVYSLGVLLYELLTGRPPFDPRTLVAGGLDQIRKIIREVDPPRPSTRLSTLTADERTTLARRRNVAVAQLSTELRGDLDWIVMKSLEKNRVRRYESASAFASDVQRYLGHEPVAARPPSTAYLLEKLIRRHRFAFAAAAAIGIVLLLGATISTWQAVRATRAERTATRAEEVARRGEQQQARMRATESELRTRAEAQSLATRRLSYASDMNLAQQALALDNLARAEELLNRQRPKPGEVDLRGWEWRYLWQFCQSEAAWVLDKLLGVRSVSVSADGNWLTVNTPIKDGRGLWNLRTRQSQPVPMHTDATVGPAAFSPIEPLLAVLTEEVGKRETAKIHLWNTATQRVERAWPIDAFYATHFGFSRDGQTLHGVNAASVTLWRVATGEKVKTFSKGFTASLIAFNADCSLAAVEWRDASVKVIDVATGQDRWIATAAREHVHAIAFSPDSSVLATAGAGADAEIRLWDVATGKQIGRLDGHRAFVRALVFWPDGETLASGSQDQTIRIWDVKKRQLKRTLHGHQGAIVDLTLMQDNMTLVSAAGDRSVRFWDTTRTHAPGAHSQLGLPVLNWAFSSDSQSILTVDEPGNVRRWHGRDFREREHLGSAATPLKPGNPPHPNVVCLPGNLPFVAISKASGVVQIWNWERRILQREIETPAERALAVAFIDGGKKVLLNYESATESVRGLFEWDLSEGKLLRSWPRAALRGEYVVSPDGRQCLVRPHHLPATIPLEPPGFIPDRGERTLIDLTSGVERSVGEIPVGGEIAQFSPDGKIFAAPLIHTTTLWRTPSFEPLKTLTGSVFGMHGAAFSPDSRRLAVTASGIEAIRIWDTTGWEQVLTLEAPASAFSITAFSPDGNVLGSRSHWSRTVHLWRAPSWAEIEAAEKTEGLR